MNFKWINESTISKSGNRWEILAPKESDFFCNNGTVGEEGVTPESLSNAPFYYTELAGDFVLRVKVSLDFKSTYDSSSVMIMLDDKNWAKACFELTDFGTHAVVSVVTKDGSSDDANGCNIKEDSIWLQICRVGQSFAFSLFCRRREVLYDAVFQSSCRKYGKSRASGPITYRGRRNPDL